MYKLKKIRDLPEEEKRVIFWFLLLLLSFLLLFFWLKGLKTRLNILQQGVSKFQIHLPSEGITPPKEVQGSINNLYGLIEGEINLK